MSTLQSLVHQQTSLAEKGAVSQQDLLSSCLSHLSTDFREAADVSLEVEDGIRCSVHSQLLCVYSEALCRSLTALPDDERVLRLKDCDARDLLNILESIYSRGRRVRSVDAAVSLTKLADTYNDGVLKAECDVLLTACADRPCSILAPKACFRTCSWADEC